MGMIRKYKDGKWRDETKEEVMAKEDIEGKRPCERCWEQARDSGYYVLPFLPWALAKAKRCPGCGRVLG